MRVAIITVRPLDPREFGGAERLFDAMVEGFRAAGHDAHEIDVLVDESCFAGIQRGYVAFRELELSGFDVVISTKAPSWLIRHDHHVCWLVHTMRVFYDMFDGVFSDPTPELLAQRSAIKEIDTLALSLPNCRKVFAIGAEVATRLETSTGLSAEVMHPPLWSDEFHCEAFGDYFFLPGRLHPWKRVDLAIEAFKRTRGAVRLLIAGTGESEGALKAAAAGDPRIEFLGRVDDAQLAALYSSCLAVPFMPLREDYGYVTLEAFASGKPVITCDDSGEAAAIVVDGERGFVTEPNPESVSQAMQRLVDDRDLARSLGLAGHQWVRSLEWPKIVARLLEASGIHRGIES